MSCYCKGTQLIHICICCHSTPCRCNHNHHNKQSSSSSSSSSEHIAKHQKQDINKVIQQIEKNYANILEQQLRKLSDRKQKQIDELLQKEGKYKSDILKLENRNKLDRDNQNRLKLEVQSKCDRIRQLQDLLNKKQLTPKTIEQITIKKSVKEEPVPINRTAQRNPNLQLDQLQDQIVKLKSRIYQLQEINKYLNDKLQRDCNTYKSSLGNMEDRIRELQQHLGIKNKQLANMNDQKTYLNEKIQILTKPSQNIQPIFLHKIITKPTEIRTVYVDRPIQKTKFIQVQRIVNKFIQPERPIVNRIVQCQDRRLCKCDSDKKLGKERYGDYQNIQQDKRSNQYQNQYDGILQNYKNQRQRLVKVIEDRNSDYRLLQKKMELYEKINGGGGGIGGGTKNKCDSIVEVKVYKDGRVQGDELHSQNSNKNKNSKIPNRDTNISNKKTETKYRR